MRRFLVASAIAGMLVCGPAAAASSPREVSGGPDGSSVIVTGHQDAELQSNRPGGGHGGGGGGGGGGSQTTAPPYGCNLPIQGVTGADAQMALVEGCPTGTPTAAPPAATAPAVDPAAVAVDVVRRHPLPVPRPTISPEPMLVALPTYLDLRTPASYTHTEPTPLGPVTLVARATATVDWGDGHVTGPTSDLGGPWPDGTLTHRYADKGQVTVTATLSWTVDWAYLGSSGTLGGLTTTASTTLTLIDAQATTD